MKPARKDQLKSLLKDTVILMCKSVNFEQDLRVEGLVGVTIDNKEVILIGFNELLCGEEDCKGTNQLDVTRSSTSSINEVNRKPRKSETSSNQSTPKIERKSNTPQSHLQIKVKNEPSEKQDETSDMIICKDSETKKPENATGHDDDLIYVGKEYYSLVTGVKQELPSTSAELIVSSVRKRPKIDQLYSAVCRKRPNVQINCDDGTHAVPVAAGSSGRQGCRAVRRRPVCKQNFVNKTTKSTNRVPSISTESVKPQTKAENSQGKKQQADRSHVASTTVMLSESKPDQFSGIQGYTKTVTCPVQTTHVSNSANLQSLTSTSNCTITPTQVIYVKSKKSSTGFGAVSSSAANNKLVNGDRSPEVTKTALVSHRTPINMHAAAGMSDSNGQTSLASMSIYIREVTSSSSVSQSPSDTLSVSVSNMTPSTPAADINQAIPSTVPTSVSPKSPAPESLVVSESIPDLASASGTEVIPRIPELGDLINLEEEEPHKEHRPKHSKQSNRSSVTCYLCGLGLSSTKALKWHMKKIHDITKPFSCSHCSKSFAWQQSFLRHMEKHDNGKDK